MGGGGGGGARGSETREWKVEEKGYVAIGWKEGREITRKN